MNSILDVLEDFGLDKGNNGRYRGAIIVALYNGINSRLSRIRHLLPIAIIQVMITILTKVASLINSRINIMSGWVDYRVDLDW